MIIGFSPGMIRQIINDPIVALKFLSVTYTMPFLSLIQYFVPTNASISSLLSKTLHPIMMIISAAIILLTTFILIVKTRKRTLSFFGCFSYFYLIMMVIWSLFSFSMPVEGYIRFMPPIVGYILIILVSGVTHFNKKFTGKFSVNPSVLICLLISINIISIATHFQFDDDVLLRKDNQELFAWIKKNTKGEDHFMHWRPETINLMTGRIGTAPWIFEEHQNEFLKRVNTFGIRYIILGKYNDREFINMFEQNAHLARLVWENNTYKIFSFDR